MSASGPTSARGRPRRSPAPNGRERLLAAARLEFARAGYSGTTVNELVAAAAVNPPTLYHHFQNKEGLFVEAAREAYDEVLGDLRAASGPAGRDFSETLAAIIQSSIRLIRDEPALAQLFLVIQFELPRQPPLEQELRPLLREFRAFFDALSSRPGAPDDPYLGRAVVAILNGLNTEALLLRSPARDYPHLVDAMLRLTTTPGRADRAPTE